MLEAGIIKLVEESEWISPMVFQEKKQDRLRICIDLRKLNDACLHDLFPTPFTDEVLENVGGREVYSFTDGFSGYHQIKIAQEDRYKTTFSTEWGYYQYRVMLFGLKNAPTIFSRLFIVAFKEFIHQFIKVYLDYWTIYSLFKYHVEAL
jgi:putative transposase